MKTIVFANHKGGVGKTTTALNVAVLLAQQGARVLAVDLDQQGNLSLALGANLAELERTGKTSARMMLDSRGDFSQYTMNVRPRLDLVPSCLDAEAEGFLLGHRIGGELLLKNKLEPAGKHYDFAVIDSPPSLHSPTLNGLTVADLIIIPIESSMFALYGIEQLLKTIAQIRKLHKLTQVIMAVSTMYTPRQNLDKDVRAQVMERFGPAGTFEATIPRAVAVGEASARLHSIVEADSSNPASFAFHKFVSEIKQVMIDEGWIVNEEEGSRKGRAS